MSSLVSCHSKVGDFVVRSLSVLFSPLSESETLEISKCKNADDVRLDVLLNAFREVIGSSYSINDNNGCIVGENKNKTLFIDQVTLDTEYDLMMKEGVITLIRHIWTYIHTTPCLLSPTLPFYYRYRHWPHSRDMTNKF